MSRDGGSGADQIVRTDFERNRLGRTLAYSWASFRGRCACAAIRRRLKMRTCCTICPDDCHRWAIRAAEHVRERGRSGVGAGARGEDQDGVE